MLNLLYNYQKKRRHIIANEEDIITVLRVTDEIQNDTKIVSPLMDMEIGNCGWLYEPEKWFMFFNMTDKQWCNFIKKIEKQNYKLILEERGNLYLTKV